MMSNFLKHFGINHQEFKTDRLYFTEGRGCIINQAFNVGGISLRLIEKVF